MRGGPATRNNKNVINPDLPHPRARNRTPEAGNKVILHYEKRRWSVDLPTKGKLKCDILGSESSHSASNTVILHLAFGLPPSPLPNTPPWARNRTPEASNKVVLHLAYGLRENRDLRLILGVLPNLTNMLHLT